MENRPRTGGVFKNLTSTRVHQIKFFLYQEKFTFIIVTLNQKSDCFLQN